MHLMAAAVPSITRLMRFVMCRMTANSFDSTCAETQIQASNLSVASVQGCMGDSDADQEHALLKVPFYQSCILQ